MIRSFRLFLYLHCFVPADLRAVLRTWMDVMAPLSNCNVVTMSMWQRYLPSILSPLHCRVPCPLCMMRFVDCEEPSLVLAAGAVFRMGYVERLRASSTALRMKLWDEEGAPLQAGVAVTENAAGIGGITLTRKLRRIGRRTSPSAIMPLVSLASFLSAPSSHCVCAFLLSVVGGANARRVVVRQARLLYAR
ncbi:hypothetical protein HBI47_114010 [Parastagonospora nodorum]|nr:hypothetical protein HBI47_114010 [Parastagonospora nodorum]